MLLNVKLELAKEMFLDREILTAADKAERKFLTDFGAYNRRVVMNSIRTAGPRDFSRAGGPPKSHPGRRNSVVAAGYKGTFFFILDRTEHAVYIGPIALNGGGGQAIPAILEGGGDELIWSGPRAQRIQRVAHYEARPHMGPAFERSLEKKLPELENCVVDAASGSALYRG